MSDTDSFIDEVTEEVRRDRLYGYLRRYGWIGILLVVLIVGGAAWREYAIARDRAAAEARGDALLAAAASRDPAGFAAVADGGEADAVVGLLAAAAAVEAEDPVAAAETLAAVAASGAPRAYRELAVLKRVLVLGTGLSPAERIALLEPISAPGAPYRLLAEEQIGLALVESGEIEAGVARLRGAAADTEASAGLRRRIQAVIVALGQESDAA